MRPKMILSMSMLFIVSLIVSLWLCFPYGGLISGIMFDTAKGMGADFTAKSLEFDPVGFDISISDLTFSSPMNKISIGDLKIGLQPSKLLGGEIGIHVWITNMTLKNVMLGESTMKLKEMSFSGMISLTERTLDMKNIASKGDIVVKGALMIDPSIVPVPIKSSNLEIRTTGELEARLTALMPVVKGMQNSGQGVFTLKR